MHSIRGRRVASLALAGLVVAALAACGSSSGSGGGASTSPSSASGGGTGPKLTIGVPFDEPGLGLKSGDTYTGFDIDTARYIAQSLGTPPQDITFVEAQPQDRETLLTSGKADLVVATYSITDERKQKVDFAGPYFVAHQDLLIRRNDETLTGPDTLNGRKLCSVTGTTSAALVKTLFKGNISLQEFPKYSDCVQALVKGDIDAVTTDDVILAGYAAQKPYKGVLRVIGKGFSDERYGVGIKKGDTEMVSKVNDALKKYIADGSWKKSLDTNVGPSGYSIPQPADARQRLTSDVEASELATFLGRYPPFDSLAPEALATVAAGAKVEHVPEGELILDAFTNLTVEVFVVVAGKVDLWNNADRITEAADERLGPGEIFGFSAMLTERSVGPRAVAATEASVARLPASLVAPAFASRRGARFLAERVSNANRFLGAPTYSLVDELIVQQPLVVDPGTPVGEVARLMTDRRLPYAAVRRSDGRFGLVTDSVLRRRVLVGGLPGDTPVEQVMEPSPATSLPGDSAVEASILLFDRDAEFLLVVDRDQKLRGVIGPRDLAVSSTTAGVSLHEQLRRAATVEELHVRARRVPAMLADLLSRGLASAKVIAVYSAILDTVVRRAIALIFEDHDDLSVNAFTWLSLGSNGRREAVLSSDVDSAVAFDDAVSPDEIVRYRAAFLEVGRVLGRAGFSSDDHGAAAHRPLFARTNADWRAAGLQWLASPADNKGAIMTSLLVDGRPIHGDPGLPAVTRVFSDLRKHPGTMRLLLQESLSARARLRPVRDVLTRRAGTFDIKAHALLPVVNIARWAALSVGSAQLPTTERLRAASGSEMLPAGQASTLVEVFEVLQRLRLRYQLLQQQRGQRPSDVFVLDRMSPIDRSIVTQAVREISSVQRRMDNISVYVPPEAWAARGPAT